MVATLARLRWRLLVNSLRRETWQLVLTLLAGVYALGLALLGVAGLIALGAVADGEVRNLILVLGGALLIVGWVVVPVVGYGINDSLDPARFALWVAPSPRFAVGLIVGGAVSIPSFVTIAICLASGLAWVGSGTLSERLIGGVVGVIVGVLAAATCFLFARLATTALSGSLRGRRTRDLLGILGFVTIMAVAFAPSLAQNFTLTFSVADWEPIADVVAWTPFGALWAIPADILAGDYLAALARVGIMAATIAVALWAYLRAVTRAMTTVTSSSAPASRRQGRLPFTQFLLERFGGRSVFGWRISPGAAAVAGRSVRYWLSDPRYQMSVVATLILPFVPLIVAFPVSQNGELGVAAAFSGACLFMAPLFGWLAGWGLHADISYDNTAFWMHPSSGIRGRDDLRGRILGYALWQGPLLILFAVLPPAFFGSAAYIPAVLGGSIGLWLAGYGVSAAVMVLLPYQVPAPGANPLAANNGGGMAGLLAMGVSMGVLFVLMIPTLLSVIPVVTVGPAWGWLTLGFGLATGVICLVCGIRFAGRRYESRSVALLTTMRGWPNS